MVGTGQNSGKCLYMYQQTNSLLVNCVYTYLLKDPMNFGAILRVAFFLGAERVIATAKNW